jgi:translation initiation factor 5A
MAYEPVKVGTIKEGRYIIEPNSGEVCVVSNIDKSKPGKHGASKARMTCIGLFDGKKREFVSSVDKRVNVPLIDKKYAQITNIEGDLIQLMDNESYEYFEVNFPTDEALATKIKENFEAGRSFDVEYWIVMDRKLLKAVRMND